MDQWCKSCLNIKVSCSTTRKKKYEKWTQNANKLFWVPEHWKNCAGLNFPISLIIRMIEKSFIVSFSGYLASRRIYEQKMDFVWFLWTWSLFFLITKCKYLHKNCFLRIYIFFWEGSTLDPFFLPALLWFTIFFLVCLDRKIAYVGEKILWSKRHQIGMPFLKSDWLVSGTQYVFKHERSLERISDFSHDFFLGHGI